MALFGGKANKDLEILRRDHETQAQVKQGLEVSIENLGRRLAKAQEDLDEAKAEEQKISASKAESERMAKIETDRMREEYETALKEARAQVEEERRKAEEAEKARVLAEEALVREVRRLEESALQENERLKEVAERGKAAARERKHEAQRLRAQGEREKVVAEAASKMIEKDLRAKEDLFDWASVAKSRDALPDTDMITQEAALSIPELEEENLRLQKELSSARAELRKLEALRADFLNLSEELMLSARSA